MRYEQALAAIERIYHDFQLGRTSSNRAAQRQLSILGESGVDLQHGGALDG